MKPPPLAYARPDALPAALQRFAAAQDEARPVAGGQSLLPMLNLRVARPDTLIDLALIPELRGIEQDDQVVDIGALTTHAQIEDGALDAIANGYLTRVARGIAYRAVRNHGTVGGSLAHADPAADWPSALLALDAQVVLVSASGRRELPLSGFFLGPFSTALADGEIIARIRFPMPAADTRWAYAKRARKLGGFAESIAAIVASSNRQSVRIVLGGAAGTPLQVPDDVARRWLERAGGPVDLAALATVEQDLSGLIDERDPVRIRTHAATVADALELT
ncbi:MAG: xanthine dehydrogenase family protein subunit M [Lautropia sp.]